MTMAQEIKNLKRRLHKVTEGKEFFSAMPRSLHHAYWVGSRNFATLKDVEAYVVELETRKIISPSGHKIEHYPPVMIVDVEPLTLEQRMAELERKVNELSYQLCVHVTTEG